MGWVSRMSALIVLLALTYIFLGLGIIRVKIANNSRIRKAWYRLPPLLKMRVVLLEPFRAVYWGFETFIVVLFAGLTGQEVDIVPEEHGDGE